MNPQPITTLDELPRDDAAVSLSGPWRPWLSAYGWRNERWRIRRLIAVSGFLASSHLLSCVARLHDHKGLLTVVARRSHTMGPPDPRLVAALLEASTRAWMSSIGDHSDTVEVVVEGDLPPHIPTEVLPDWM